MPLEQAEKIEEAFVFVLEKLAFMFAERTCLSEIPTEVEAPLQADIQFSGQASGQLTLAVSEDICGDLTANILGTDPDDLVPSESSNDALKELINVICGRLLTAIAGDEPVFNLTSPEVKQIDAQTWQSMLADPDAIGFLVDDSPVVLRLAMAPSH